MNVDQVIAFYARGMSMKYAWSAREFEQSIREVLEGLNALEAIAVADTLLAKERGISDENVSARAYGEICSSHYVARKAYEAKVGT